MIGTRFTRDGINYEITFTQTNLPTGKIIAQCNVIGKRGKPVRRGRFAVMEGQEVGRFLGGIEALPF